MPAGLASSPTSPMKRPSTPCRPCIKRSSRTTQASRQVHLQLHLLAGSLLTCQVRFGLGSCRLTAAAGDAECVHNECSPAVKRCPAVILDIMYLGTWGSSDALMFGQLWRLTKPLCRSGWRPRSPRTSCMWATCPSFGALKSGRPSSKTSSEVRLILDGMQKAPSSAGVYARTVCPCMTSTGACRRHCHRAAAVQGL